jgi:hypothetical protein
MFSSALADRFVVFLLRAFGVAIAAASCGDPRASFTTKVASDFSPSGHSVSVFGVFKEGRMSPETWGELGAGLSSAFGALAPSACPAEYSDDFVTSSAPLSSAIDDYARANGIGDELLDAVAPAATGDLIAVFTMAGKVGSTDAEGRAGGATTGGMPPAAPSTMMRRGQQGGMPLAGPMTDPRRGFREAPVDALELSASLFSVSQHRSVALVAMRYVGDSLPDALAELAAKLRAAVPGSTCAAWNSAVHLDERKIRALAER